MTISAPAFSRGVNGVGIGHDQVRGLRLSTADFVGLFDQPAVFVVVYRTEHDHAHSQAKLGVDNLAAFAGHHELPLEAEIRHSQSIALAASRYRKQGNGG